MVRPSRGSDDPVNGGPVSGSTWLQNRLGGTYKNHWGREQTSGSSSLFHTHIYQNDNNEKWPPSEPLCHAESAVRSNMIDQC